MAEGKEEDGEKGSNEVTQHASAAAALPANEAATYTDDALSALIAWESQGADGMLLHSMPQNFAFLAGSVLCSASILRLSSLPIGLFKTRCR